MKPYVVATLTAALFAVAAYCPLPKWAVEYPELLGAIDATLIFAVVLGWKEKKK